MKTIAEKVAEFEVPASYDMRTNEIRELLDMPNNARAIRLAFQYGYLKGSRATAKSLAQKLLQKFVMEGKENENK